MPKNNQKWLDKAKTIIGKKPAKLLKAREDKVFKLLEKLDGQKVDVGDFREQYTNIKESLSKQLGGDNTEEIERQSLRLSELKKKLSILSTGKVATKKSGQKLASREESNYTVELALTKNRYEELKRRVLDGQLHDDLETIGKKIQNAEDEKAKRDGKVADALSKLREADTDCGSLEGQILMHVQALNDELDKVTTFDEAEKIAGNPPTNQLDVEIKTFTDARDDMNKESKAGEWTKAKTIVTTRVKPAADALVTSRDQWLAMSTRFSQISTLYSNAFSISQNTPTKLKTDCADLLRRFRDADSKSATEKKNKNWVEALNQYNLLGQHSAALVKEMQAYSTAKNDYQLSYDKIKQEHDDASNAYNAFPARLKTTRDECKNFLKEHQAWRDAVDSQDWAKAKTTITPLKDTFWSLTNGNIYDAFEQQDFTEVEKKLTSLETKIKENTEKSSNSFIKKLSKEITNQEKEVRKLLKGPINFGPKLVIAMAELVQLLNTAADRRSAYSKYRKAYLNVYGDKSGKVTVIKNTLGDDPAELAKIRDDELENIENQISKISGQGKYEFAMKKVAEAAKLADGWLNGWNEAKEAKTALEVGPDDAFDEEKIKALINKDGGKVIDSLIKNAKNPPRRDVIAKIMKLRYGCDLDLKVYKRITGENNKVSFAFEDDKRTEGSKSVKKLYDMLGAVPEKYAKSDSLKKIVRVGGEGGQSSLVGSSHYQSGTKTVVLECGRQRETGGTELGSSTELPNVDDMYKPAGKTGAKLELSYFDWTTLHEIGHAVDDQAKFMKSKKSLPEMGGWATYGSEVSLIAEALQGDDRFKADGEPFDLDYIKNALAGKPGDAPDVPDDVDEQKWNAAKEAIDKWISAVRVDKKLWKDGAGCTNLAIKGRVYHEAYANDWVSYDLAARTRGIRGYQFRAPGEWFAELYAAYYSEQLKPGHPFAKIVETELQDT